MIKYLEEVLKIAQELDDRGLHKEAISLDKIASNIISFKDRVEEMKKRKLDPELVMPEIDSDEELSEEKSEEKPLGDEMADVISISEVIPSRLREESYFPEEEGFYSREAEKKAVEFVLNNLMPESIINEDGDTLGDYLESGSEELKEYMIEYIPEAVENLGYSMGEYDLKKAYDLILDVALSRPEYEYNDDFNYAIRNMSYYLRDYQWPRVVTEG
jgi:hypothetical protein|tara:strand:+ start:1908 stop:2555 length:648 start_codon:yes stop_codon:yes gene_type:complete